MENIKSSVSLNLSSQANTCSSKKSSISQFNYFIILGLGYLNTESRPEEPIPICINVNKSGELTIEGLDVEIINDQNTQIYSDKKVTTSED